MPRCPSCDAPMITVAPGFWAEGQEVELICGKCHRMVVGVAKLVQERRRIKASEARKGVH